MDYRKIEVKKIACQIKHDTKYFVCSLTFISHQFYLYIQTQKHKTLVKKKITPISN